MAKGSPPARVMAPAAAPLALRTDDHDAQLGSQLDALATACAACRCCGLAGGRQQVVVGRGHGAARLMLIGEAPGAQEDAAGVPFVGRSGLLLDQLLAGAGIASDRDVYICNVVKCRPPDNRRPTAAEMAACRPWLEQQIALVDPALILLVGASALQGVLGIKGGITRLRGQWLPGDGGLLTGRWLMPLLHPAYLLRNPRLREGSPRWHTAQDLLEVRRCLDGGRPGGDRPAGGRAAAQTPGRCDRLSPRVPPSR